MGNRAIDNRLRKLQLLEEQAKLIESQINDVKEELKQLMTEIGVEELATSNFQMSYKTISSRRFDSSAFQQVHPQLYEAFKRESSYQRFTYKALK